MHRAIALAAAFGFLLVVGAEAGGGLVQARPGQEAGAAVVAPVDINAAGVEELETLPGVGPRTAQLIVEYRDESGGFTKIEELMNVRGIGEKTFLRLRALVTVGTRKGR